MLYRFALIATSLLLTLACGPASGGSGPNEAAAGSPNIKEAPPPPDPSGGTPAAERQEKTTSQQSAAARGTQDPASAEEQSAGEALLQRIRARQPFYRKFLDARPSRWELRTDIKEDDFPLVGLNSDTDYIAVVLSCIPADKQTDYRVLDVSISRAEQNRYQSRISFFFRDDSGEDIKSLSWQIRPERPEEPDPIWNQHVGVTYRMGEMAQEVIDGMLAEGVSKMVVEFYEGPNDEDNRSLSFSPEGIVVINELLTEYCQQTADETLAAVAADVLKAPTATPTPSPSPTPTPLVTFRQEWCRERGSRPFEKEAIWYRGGKGEGSSARFIMRCTGGTLVAGLHTIRSDGQYPENRTGVAIAPLVNGKVKPYQYYPDGWQQMSGEAGGGRFILFPDEALQEVVRLIERERYGGAKKLGFWVLFDAVPDPQPGTKQYDQRLGPDAIVPIRSDIRGRFMSYGIHTAPSAPTPRPTPTPTAPPTQRPQPVSASLTAEFVSVPASHNGEDAIRFQLQFTEPVATGYKVLRDTAIQVENGSVRESKRVDGRSDLWRVTVEPEGNEDMVITLTAPANCQDPAAVCTKGEKQLSNQPVARVSYGGLAQLRMGFAERRG